MFTNEEALILKEIGVLLNGLGADTTKLKRVFKMTVDVDSLTLAEKQRIQELLAQIP
jgi:methylphosphotriester-DNA--protein-cysteine methyltransferase